jgi:CRP-like cAMP-binding protein
MPASVFPFLTTSTRIEAMTDLVPRGAAHLDATSSSKEPPPQPGSALERGNTLLKSLDESAWTAIEPHLEHGPLTAGELLEERGTRAKHLYFPITGAVSLEANADSRRMQLALVGREGIIGTSLLLEDVATHRAVVQFRGTAWRVRADELATCVENSRALQRQLLRGVNAFIDHLSLTAMANVQGTIEQRLARWLLTAAERLDTDVLAITHETVSHVLGVRRAGVTTALHKLEGKSALRSERGHVRILARELLIVAAGPYACGRSDGDWPR